MNKDPSVWSLIINFIKESPTIQGAIMAMIISALRVVYDGEKRPVRVGLESLICGFLSLGVSGIVEFLGMPQNMVVTISGAIGFIGVQKIRELILKKVHKEYGFNRYDDDTL